MMIAIVSFPLQIMADNELVPCGTDVKQMVTCYANKHGINVSLAQYVVSNESQYDINNIGDMDIICKTGPNKGKPVRARGLMQITDCYYPEVTDEQAFNPDFNLEFGMKLMKDK